MSELARLACELEKGGKVTLILSETHLTLEPDADFAKRTLGAVEKGMSKTEDLTGFFGWVARTAIGAANQALDKLFAPHPLDEIELSVTHDRVSIKLDKFKGMNMEHLSVDPTEAFIFDAKFRQAREALAK